jgi:hypothetical protein
MFRFSEKSGVHGFSGLHGTSGVYGNSGVYKVSGFNPLDLDPYLLFDAETSMIGTFENPTLDLDPATPSTLDVITATRSSVATRTLPDGTIALAEQDTVRVDYTQGEQLTPTKFQRFVNTEFDQAYWSFSSQMGNPVYNYDTAPNGEQEATRIVSNGGSYPQIVETIEGLTIGQQYTASFYVKSDGTSQIQQTTHFTGLSGGIGFTPTDNWERASYTITATATTHSFVIFTNGSSTPASSYLIWGPQLEEGTTASDFVENTTGSPKFISSAVYSDRVPMVLIEPSATNLVDYSEDFSDSYWTKSGSSVVSGQTSPSGDTSAYKLVEDTNNGEHKVSTGIIFVSAGNTDTYSVFVKRAGRTKVAIREEQHGGKYVSFNLLSKTVISNTGLTANIIDLSDDWLRIDYSQNSGGGLEKFSLFLLDDTYTSGSPTAHSYTGDGTSGVYIWGAQVEAGSVATSYIPNPAPISSALNSVTSFEADGSVGGFNNIHVESIAGISGKEVEVEFEIFDYVSGTSACLMGHAFTPSIQVGGSLNANGIYRGVVTADSNNRILFRNNSNTDNFTGKIRNIKVVEVDTSGARAADNLVITGSDFDFYNGSEGTFYVELIDKNILDIASHLYLHGGGNNLILYSNGNSANVANYDNANFLQFSGIPSNQLIRMALSYESSTKKLSVNGNTSSDSAYNGNYSGISSLTIGTNLSGHIKRVLFWPYSSDRL